MNRILQELKADAQRVNSAMESYLAADDRDFSILFDAMRYSLLAGGKRLRPIFVLDFCAMCGGDWQKALPFATAVEIRVI